MIKPYGIIEKVLPFIPAVRKQLIFPTNFRPSLPFSDLIGFFSIPLYISLPISKVFLQVLYHFSWGATDRVCIPEGIGGRGWEPGLDLGSGDNEILCARLVRSMRRPFPLWWLYLSRKIDAHIRTPLKVYRDQICTRFLFIKFYKLLI